MFLSHAGTDSVPRGRPALRNLQEDNESCFIVSPWVRMGGPLEEWKGCGQRRRSGFQSCKLSGASQTPPEENKVKFAKLLLYHMNGSTHIRRAQTVSGEAIFNVPISRPNKKGSGPKTDGEGVR
jgi:hypothetical protein